MFSSEVFSVLTLGLRLRENIENIFFLNHLLQNRLGFNESLDTHLGNTPKIMSGKS